MGKSVQSSINKSKGIFKMKEKDIIYSDKDVYEFTGNTYDNIFRGLTRELRDYVSDMVKDKLP